MVLQVTTSKHLLFSHPSVIVPGALVSFGYLLPAQSQLEDLKHLSRQYGIDGIRVLASCQHSQMLTYWKTSLVGLTGLTVRLRRIRTLQNTTQR